MQILKKSLNIAIIAIIISFCACSTVTDEPTEPQTPATPDSANFVTVTNNGFSLKYRTETTNLHCFLSANSTGWIAVGFNPTSGMKNANFIIGYVENGVAFTRDDFGVSNTSHDADVNIGGVSNIENISGSESAGITTIEFRIPLNSGDSKDQILTVGQTYPIIFAKGNSDNYTDIHSGIGSTTIFINF